MTAAHQTIEAIAPPAAPGSLIRLLVFLLPASAGLIALFMSLGLILLPAQLEAIDPALKVHNLAVLTTLNALTGVVGLLAGGAISDRTAGRFGRRTPWLVAMSGASLVLVTALGRATSIGAVLAISSILYLACGFYQATIYAVLPDRVPASSRGTASSVMGIGMPLGLLAGLTFAARVPSAMAYPGLGVAFVITTLVFVIFAREAPAEKSPIKPVRPANVAQWLSSVGEFVSGFASRDFTLAFASRALMFLGYYAVINFAFYILQDMVGAANVPNGNVKVAVSLLGSMQMGAWLVSGPIAGRIADRFDCTKRVISVAALGMVVALAIPFVLPTWGGMVAMYIVVGACFGTYISVDLALMSFVLPNKKTAGRDMAILTMASTGPQLISPMISGLIITVLGYPPLFVFGALLSLMGGAAAFAIKKVR